MHSSLKAASKIFMVYKLLGLGVKVSARRFIDHLEQVDDLQRLKEPLFLEHVVVDGLTFYGTFCDASF